MVAHLHYWNMHDSVRINRMARFLCAADWSWETAGCSTWMGDSESTVPFNFDLWTVLEGSGQLEAATETYAIGAGDCFILRGDARYRATHDPHDPLTVVAVHYDYLDEEGLVVLPDTRLHRRVAHPAFFTHLLERTEHAWMEDAGRDAAFWLRACLMEIARQDREAVRHGIRRRHADRIDAICEEIRRQPGAPWGLDMMAARLHCTRHHVTRLFKDAKRISPSEFVIGARMDAAKGLLHSSSYTIGRIAEILGYRDIYYFSRQFKQRVGTNPTAYRKGG